MLISTLTLRCSWRLKSNIRCITKVFSTHTTGKLPSATGFNDYDAEINAFKLDVPEYFNFATDVIDKWCVNEKNGERDFKLPAFWLVDDLQQETKWSFEEIAEKSKEASMLLQQMCGICEGDRVLVILPRIPEWWLINIACLRIGAVLIPGTTQLTSRDIENRINQARIKCVIADSNVVPNVEKIKKNCPTLECKIEVPSLPNTRRPDWYNFRSLWEDANTNFEPVKSKSDDLMTIYFTSGTTGLPKMTGHTHASYGLACKITGRYWLDLAPSDVHWNLSDTGWAKSAWSNLFAPWMQGSCVFIYNAPTFVASDILQNPEVIEEWYKHTGQQIREGYGQTETVLQVGAFRCLENKVGSMGKPAPGMPVKVIDENCNETPAGQEGDIAIKVKPERPLGLFMGYMDDEKQTKAAFKGDYYLTGDRAIRDEDGYLWFVGRADDVILSSGYRIGPFEVESALIEHPAVVESAVVSSPDEIRGEVVKAFVVLAPKYKDCNQDNLKADLQGHVKQTTAPYKYPRKIEFVQTLPKTVSGKIRRIELRNTEWNC